MVSTAAAHPNVQRSRKVTAEPVDLMLEVLEGPPIPVLGLESGARCAELAAKSREPSSVTDLFFSGEPADITKACRICLACPVRDVCYDAAVSRREAWGVWGGRLFESGKIVTVKRRRGRPRKGGPRPGEVFVDVAG